MVATTLNGVMLTGDHASRPAASAVAKGTLYSCTTHSLIYQSDASSWSTWATLTGTGLSDPMTTRGDIIIRNASNVTARLGIGSSGKVLSSDGTDISWQTPTSGNFVQLADTVLGSDTANFDLTSISGSYKHLRLELFLRSDRAAQTFDTIKLLVNNDTGANYDYDYGSEGTGSGYPGFQTDAYGQTSSIIGQSTAAAAPTGTVGTMTLTFPNYAGTTFHKPWHGEGVVQFDTTSGNIRYNRCVGRWASTSAITRLTVSPVNGSNWKTGSRATLYGLS